MSRFSDFCASFKTDVANIYKQRLGIDCHLDNPITFTEKIQWCKVFDSTFMKSYCTDKILLHKYVHNKIGTDIAVPIIDVWENTNDIQWKHLPERYAIKCNHGSGMNIICRHASSIDIKLTASKLNQWQHTNFCWQNGYEMHYYPIKPLIFAETFLDDGRYDITDYKFYCCNGEPMFCQVITDRTNSNGMNITHYDKKWHVLHWLKQKHYPDADVVQMPKQYEYMLDVAKVLSSDFKFVRVDFYVVNDKVYLGELTFTPASGYIIYADKDADTKLGNMVEL